MQRVKKKTVKKKKNKSSNFNPKSLKNLIPGTSEDNYDPEYCQDIIEFMSQGYSILAWAGKIKRGKSTVYRWIEKYPEFAEAHEIGIQKALMFFETMLISAIRGIIPKTLRDQGSRKLDVQAIIFALRARFHKEYGDKAEVNHRSEDGTMSPQRMTDEELAKKAKEYGIE